jgi:hypothetical protein
MNGRPDFTGIEPGGELNLILFSMLADDQTAEQAIRPDMKKVLDEYGRQERPTLGGFTYALLSNNLQDAAARADPYNKVTLVPLVYYVINRLPAPCHGSEKAVDAWLEGAKKKFQHANRQQPTGVSKR